MLTGFLLVHGTIAGDFRRAVKSLARQGRLEEAEDKNRKSASVDTGAVWSAQKMTMFMAMLVQELYMWFMDVYGGILL